MSVPAVPGVTYRQLDSWTSRGWLKPDHANPGTGRKRVWPARELQVAELMGRMVTAGIAVEVAASAARQGHGKAFGFKLGPGIYLLIGDDDIVSVVGLGKDETARMDEARNESQKKRERQARQSA